MSFDDVLAGGQWAAALPGWAVRARSDQRGQAMVEFVIAVPVVLVLMLAVVQLAAVYNNWVALTDAARAGARVAAESRTNSNRVQNVRDAVTKSASSDLMQTRLVVDDPQTSWAPGSKVTVCAHYPYSVNIMAIVVKSGNLDACTTQLVQ